MIIAPFSAVAGILLLAHAWHGASRRPWRRQQLIRGLAFVLLAVAVSLLASATGAVRAIAIALLMMMLTAGAILTPIGWRAWRGQRSATERIPATTSPRPDWPVIARVTWISLLAGPVSGIAALLSAAALSHLATDWSAADRVGFVTVLAPLLWALLAVVATYAASLRQRTLIATGAMATALGLAWLSTGGTG